MTSNKPSLVDLIPDYIAGDLDPENRALFEKQLVTDSHLRRELDEFLALRELYKEAQQDPPPPSDAVFHRIEATIEKHERQQDHRKRTPHSTLPGRWSATLAVWERVKTSFALPWGLAAVQAALIIILLLPGNQQETGYQTLGQETAARTTHPQPSFNIVFIDSAREADIRALLVNARASIIAGPSPEGRYIITIQADNNREQLLSTLRQADIVRFLETTSN